MPMEFRKLVSLENRTLVAAGLFILLLPASWIYGLIIRVRNALYDAGILIVGEAKVPVVSIGNITVGGTGKTPLVIWLANRLIADGCKTAVLTRGYKSDAGKISDEPAIIQKACAGVRVLIDSNRVSSAQKAVSEFGAGLLLLDDGFSHRRLGRDLDIMAIDATCPFGYGRMLPAGLLREPLNQLKRAKAFILTRCDLVCDCEIAAIIARIHCIRPDAVIAQSRHVVSEVQLATGKRKPISSLAGQKVMLFCGIGNPDAFFDGMKKAGLNIAATKSFADHHNYSQADIDGVAAQARAAGAGWVVTTEKDFVKLERLSLPAELNLGFTVLTLEFLAGEDTIYDLVLKASKH